MLEWNVVRVSKQTAMAHLKPKLNGYRRSYQEVYIGVTSAPALREQQHAAEGWAKMVVVYEALNSGIAVKLEQDLIDYARRCNFKTGIANVGDGGEGVRDSAEKHYVYFLLG